MNITLIATTIMGFESILAQELKDLGFKNITVHNTKVEFSGTLSDICRANLWLRTAGRVYVKIAQFKATTFDELFDQTAACPWEQWIQPNDKFPIHSITAKKSKLFSKSDGQSIVKKAIVERLKKAHGCQVLPETKALFNIRVQIENDIVILSIDTSGTGLNKRGYRAHMSTAPLRETLAAGLVLLSRWKADRDVLMDPFCGTGTILIEAAMIAKNIAPGLQRTFASDQWQCIAKKQWQASRQQATDMIDKGATCRIYGSDNNPRVLSIANKNIQLAGLTDIYVQNRDISEVSSRFEYGKLITNPPYGERLSDAAEIEALYTTMGQIFKEKLKDWSYYILTPSEDFSFLFKQKPSKKRKLYNGGMLCWYYQYFAKVHLQSRK